MIKRTKNVFFLESSELEVLLLLEPIKLRTLN